MPKRPKNIPRAKQWRLFELEKERSRKTSLFTKIFQMERLSSELERINLLPTQRRSEWIEENEPYLGEMMEDLLNTSSMALEAMDGDEADLELSINYVSELRKLTTVVRSILDDKNSLEG